MGAEQLIRETPMPKLTAKGVEGAKPRETRYEIPDNVAPGLALIVEVSGGKRWAVRYRLNGRKRRVALGKYPRVSLAEARAEGRRIIERVERGEDPAADRARGKAAERAEAAATGVALDRRETVEGLAYAFLRLEIAPKRSAQTLRDYKYALQSYVLPRFADRRPEDITRAEVAALLDEIIAAGKPIQANRVLATIRRMYNWAVDRGRVAENPVARMRAPSPERPRERVLSEREIAALWTATGRMEAPGRQVARLLLLTGQRSGEVAGMRRGEIDLSRAVWELPGTRTKNGRAHVVPLSPAAVAEIEAAPGWQAGAEFILGATGHSAFSGFSKLKTRLDKMLAAELGEEVEHWTLHDIRRTVATGLASLGVPVAVTEKVLNHVSGTFGGVTGVYQRFQFLDERRDALERWADHIARTADLEGAVPS